MQTKFNIEPGIFFFFFFFSNYILSERGDFEPFLILFCREEDEKKEKEKS
jgi:hypothetical protein